MTKEAPSLPLKRPSFPTKERDMNQEFSEHNKLFEIKINANEEEILILSFML